MNIRRAKKEDIPQIEELLYQVHKVHSDGRPDLFKAGEKKYTTKELEALVQNDEKPIFVAEDKEGKWELVDGLQRLSTVLSFFGLLKNDDKNNWIMDAGDLVPEL